MFLTSPYIDQAITLTIRSKERYRDVTPTTEVLENPRGLATHSTACNPSRNVVSWLAVPGLFGNEPHWRPPVGVHDPNLARGLGVPSEYDLRAIGGEERNS